MDVCAIPVQIPPTTCHAHGELPQLYFDVEDDGLRGEGLVGTKRLRMLALEIWRRELRLNREDAVSEREDRLKARREKDEESEETTVS